MHSQTCSHVKNKSMIADRAKVRQTKLSEKSDNLLECLHFISIKIIKTKKLHEGTDWLKDHFQVILNNVMLEK